MPGFFEILAIFRFGLLTEFLKMALMSEDLPELDLPTKSNYFYFSNKVLSYSICCSKNLGRVV